MAPSSFLPVDFYNEYSVPQLKIITDLSPVKQVIAAAGSGKTRTVTGLIAHRLLLKLYEPEKILLLSFSRKAVRELRERIPPQFQDSIEISTFHSFALRWLSRLHPEFSHVKVEIMDEEKKTKYFQNFFRKHSDVIGGIPFHILLSDPAFLRDLFPDLSARLYEDFESYKKERNLLEYGDLIRILVEDLKTQKPYLNSLRNEYDLIIVDEFQDTDPEQLVFLKEMKCRELVVVGDDWQAIYAFRGASVAPFLNFKKQFRNAKIFYLSENYRSLPEIILLGNHVIRFSEKQLKKKVKAVRNSFRKNSVFAVPVRKGIEKNIFEILPASLSYKILTRSNRRRLDWIEAGFPEENVMTIHKSKGLEFHCVFLDITGGWSAYDPEGGKEETCDEEIRIAYVGLTRARDHLVVLYDPDAPPDRGQGALFENVFSSRIKILNPEKLGQILSA